jgi:predicted nucleic acid-binding protein
VSGESGLAPAADPSTVPAAPEPAAVSAAPPRVPYVIDTCVAIKWYIPEALQVEARRYMGPGLNRHAPDLLPVEAGHALLKRVRSADPAQALTFDEVRTIVAAARDSAPIQYHSSQSLLDLALALAEQIGASVYDGLFLALAIRIDGQVVTADQKFYNKIVVSPHAGRARWVAMVP